MTLYLLSSSVKTQRHLPVTSHCCPKGMKYNSLQSTADLTGAGSPVMLGRAVSPIVGIEVSSNDSLAPNLRVTGPHTEIDIKTLGKDDKNRVSGNTYMF